MNVLSKFLCRKTLFKLLLTLLITLLIIVIAIAINLWGIRMAGDIVSWEHWLKEQAPLFFIWRLILYTSTIYGWLWMRKRILQRETSQELQKVQARLRRVEICAVASIVLLEISCFMAQG